jgi:Flp pilus assembly protein TadB
MDAELVAAIVGAGAGLVTTLVQVSRSRSGRHGRLKDDLELLQLLPKESAARADLLRHVDAGVKAMITDTQTKRRDATGIGLGLTMVLLSVLFIVLAIANGGWWWAGLALAVPIGLIGAVGFGQDVRLLERDEKGRPISG